MEWNTNIRWIENGEPVDAAVANRPTLDVWNNLQYSYDVLQNHVNNYNNPHRVTAKQLGIDLSGVSNINDLLAQIVNDIMGSFIADGFVVKIHSIDEVNSKITIKVSGGRAYINGKIINSTEEKFIDIKLNNFFDSESGEPKIFNSNNKVYKLNNGPLGNTTSVLADVYFTEIVTRGSVPGGKDYLSNSPVLEVVEVKQGPTVYSAGIDYFVDGNAIDWSLWGNEPSPGSTYTVRYLYRAQLEKNVHYVDGSNLLTGNNYYVFVASVNGTSESKFDSSKVKVFNVTKNGKYVNVYWNAVPNADYYKVYLSTDGNQFYLAGTTYGTSFSIYGVTISNEQPKTDDSTLSPATITNIYQQYSSAIVFLANPGIKENSSLLIFYTWYMPSYALLYLNPSGNLDIVYGIPAREPVAPKVPADCLGIMKFYVPGLDPSKFTLTDIREFPFKINRINSVVKRLDNLETTFLRKAIEDDLVAKDTNPKKGLFADNFSDPKLVDITHPLYYADYILDGIESKRVNLKSSLLTTSSLNGLIQKNSKCYLDFDSQIEIQQLQATRTIDVAAATFNTESPNPVILVNGKGKGEKLQLAEGMYFTVEIFGFDPSSTVDVIIGPTTVGTLSTNEFGYAKGTFQVPENLVQNNFTSNIINGLSGEVANSMQSIFNVLKSAERTLWPTQTSTTTSSVTQFLGSTWWSWWARTDTFRTTTTTTTVTTNQRLGLSNNTATNIDVSAIYMMDIKAQSQSGKFASVQAMITVDPVTVPASVPEFTLSTERSVSTSVRSSIFSVVSRWVRDPVAESFYLEEDGMITSIDIRFASASDVQDSDVIFKFGLLEDGFPSKNILFSTRIPRQDVVNAINNNNGWLTVNFDVPIYAKANQYFFFSVGAEVPGYRVYCAQLGDSGVNMNPYPAGTFFYSGDGNTWTAIQERDLTFRVRTAKFKNAGIQQIRGTYKYSGEVVFNTITGLNASVATLLAHYETFPGCSVLFFVSDDNGVTWQPIKDNKDKLLGKVVTSLKVKAVLVSNNDRLSPILNLDGINLISYKYATNSRYVSTMIEMLQPADSVDIFVTASVPEGKVLTVKVTPDNGNTWITCNQVSADPVDLNRNLFEYKFSANISSQDTKYRILIEMPSDTIKPIFIDKVGMLLR
ncbi:MAG: DUF4815 domain-containing protein [Candidatus Aenigmatarchaeota archaeon]